MTRHWPVFLILFLKLCLAYKPVVLIHGILTGPASMLIIEGEVKKVKDHFSCVLMWHTYNFLNANY